MLPHIICNTSYIIIDTGPACHITIIGPVHHFEHHSPSANNQYVYKSMRYMSVVKRFGAGEGIRTLDPNLGKVVLYHWATPAPYPPKQAGSGYHEPLPSCIIQASRPCKRQITRSSRGFMGFLYVCNGADVSGKQKLWKNRSLGCGQRVFQAVGNVFLLGCFKIGMHRQGQYMIA